MLLVSSVIAVAPPRNPLIEISPGQNFSAAIESYLLKLKVKELKGCHLYMIACIVGYDEGQGRLAEGLLRGCVEECLSDSSLVCVVGEIIAGAVKVVMEVGKGVGKVAVNGNGNGNGNGIDSVCAALRAKCEGGGGSVSATF